MKAKKISTELKWCLGFMKAVILRGHRRHRTRKKNIHRVQQMSNKALKRWGCYPLPPEWITN